MWIFIQFSLPRPNFSRSFHDFFLFLLKTTVRAIIPSSGSFESQLGAISVFQWFTDCQHRSVMDSVRSAVGVIHEFDNHIMPRRRDGSSLIDGIYARQ